MINDFWLNLPVKNIAASKAFFSALGFTFNTKMGDTSNSACLLIGKKEVVVMLFDEPTFKNFTNVAIPDTASGSQTLLSIGVDSKEEADALAVKVVTAGGKCSHVPHAMDSWMYGYNFLDLDRHRWNVLYMDRSKM